MEHRVRCQWVPLDKDYYVAYHDQEWGVQIHDDRQLFELLVLEGAQAGLSWDTVLRKREGYRRAFAHFDPQEVARFDAEKALALQLDPAIVRNRLKIASAIRNARVFLALQEEFGSFARFLWGFVDHQPKINHWRTLAELPATSVESDRIAKELKKRGMNFVGSTIIYAYMQSAGLVMDHTVDCFRYQELVG
ncbi:MAG: DNA-3-methyladenine glycosylase I [Magnetococcales bacterium]|nr:DNA-3-methyladenine glycosylase I [Magnetococcales bacterium]MBF0116209.1 DNA-3-methyladenine glycosylase I [Magnetococcales bacterium]